MRELAVIIPVYNEEAIVETVINEWLVEFNKHDIDYSVFVYNDGSSDNTLEILENLAKKNPQLVVINQENSWHGPTILRGYKEKAKDFEWIFQIDADREVGPDDFVKLWDKRFEYDFLIAKRFHRKQILSRKIISFISRFCVKLFYGFNGPWDVNSPYRLMKSQVFMNIFNQLPDKTLSPNMIIAGVVAKKKISYFEYPLDWEQRKTGSALSKLKLLRTSIKSFLQCMIFSFKVK